MIIPVPLAPAPPPPTNPSLPPAPAQGIIVEATDPSWSSFIQFTMPDNDVVEINAGAATVTRYFSKVGTINLGLAANPANGDLYVANTDALNLVRFEPNLRGHFTNNQITRISIASGKRVHEPVALLCRWVAVNTDLLDKIDSRRSR
jgi:hypothetical protein